MEKLPSKQIQSRYSSLSENKYHFMHRLDTNNKLELDNFGDNDNYKENYGPVDSIRKSKNINNIRHMNNSGKKYILIGILIMALQVGYLQILIQI